MMNWNEPSFCLSIKSASLSQLLKLPTSATLEISRWDLYRTVTLTAGSKGQQPVPPLGLGLTQTTVGFFGSNPPPWRHPRDRSPLRRNGDFSMGLAFHMIKVGLGNLDPDAVRKLDGPSAAGLRENDHHFSPP